MKNTYQDLIEQSYYFPQEGFDLQNGYLTFHGVSLKYLIDKYGTPLRLMYLPSIGEKIRKAKNLFKRAMKKHRYDNMYHYCYCTKCCHFNHVVEAALKEDVHLETSSSFDIDLIRKLHAEDKVKKSCILVHNGFKTDSYLDKVISLQKDGFKNSIMVLDSMKELDRIVARAEGHPVKIGIRMAIEEEPQASYYTSRLGIRRSEIMDFYLEKIKDNPAVDLKMFHFFVDSGIKDNLYYWDQFQKALELYVTLKKEAPGLKGFNLGGGFPIRNNLGFSFDYEGIIDQIIERIKNICDEENIPVPEIFTEFGKYTVGESGAIILSVIEQKQQNDSELWYIVDNSLMNTIPDAWSIFEKFILLPINQWNNPYKRVNIGGISCDHSDYYNSEELNQQVLLPTIDDEANTPLYIGFFHSGAYQDSISGYGGIKHCLIPSPKHVIINRDERGNFVDTLYRGEQTMDEMLSILGYK